VKIPKYAKGVPRCRLVRFFCKTACRTGRFGEVSDPNWQPDDASSDVFVRCLKCGNSQPDKSNWEKV